MYEQGKIDRKEVLGILAKQFHEMINIDHLS